jgi:hypothetical protein
MVIVVLPLAQLLVEQVNVLAHAVPVQELVQNGSDLMVIENFR